MAAKKNTKMWVLLCLKACFVPPDAVKVTLALNKSGDFVFAWVLNFVLQASALYSVQAAVQQLNAGITLLSSVIQSLEDCKTFEAAAHLLHPNIYFALFISRVRVGSYDRHNFPITMLNRI